MKVKLHFVGEYDILSPFPEHHEQVDDKKCKREQQGHYKYFRHLMIAILTVEPPQNCPVRIFHGKPIVVTTRV